MSYQIQHKLFVFQIVAHFYGHLHTDSFRIFQGDFAPVGVAFIAPSITPLVYVRKGVNPSFRSYTYNPVKGKIMTYKQYFLPLDLITDKYDEEDDEYDDNDDEKNDANQKVIGMAAPKYLSVEGHENCLGQYNPTPSYTAKCLPSSKPDGCSNASWQELKNVFNGQDCPKDEDRRSQSARELKLSADRRALNSKFLSKRQADDDEETVDITTEASPDASEPTPTTTSSSSSSSTSEQSVENVDANDNSTMNEKVKEPVETTTELSNDTKERKSQLKDQDPDLAYLVDKWIFAYNAALDYKLESMDVKSMYKVYSDIKTNRTSESFKYFWRHSFVLRIKSDLDCDDMCAINITCAIFNIRTDDFKDCVNTEIGARMPDKHPWAPALSTTRSPPPTTRRIPITTPRPSSSVTKNDINDDDANIGITEKEFHGKNTYGVGKGIAVGCVLVAIVALIIGGIYAYKRIQRRRYCSQEFLLDSFRYDGYSQIDQP